MLLLRPYAIPVITPNNQNSMRIASKSNAQDSTRRASTRVSTTSWISCLWHNTQVYAGTLPISTSFLCCLATHLSANQVTTVTTMLIPKSKNTTSVPYSANLLSWHRLLKLLLLRRLGTLMSWGSGWSFLYLQVQVWMVSRSGVPRLSTCAQTTVRRVRRKQGRIVPRETRARRVYFWRRASCTLLALGF